MGWSSGPLGVAMGINGRGSYLTFDLKCHFQILKMEPRKAEWENTHPETLAIYTHTFKMSGFFSLIDDHTTHTPPPPPLPKKAMTVLARLRGMLMLWSIKK